MAGDTDFIALYQELGLDAGCTLDSFRQAYRKRVGILHPDRQADGVCSINELQQLNALYASALEFHRRHGRLPGATQAMNAGATPEPIASQTAPDRRQADVGEDRRKPGPILAVLVLVLVGLWFTALLAPSESATPLGNPIASSRPNQTRPELQRSGQAIELGASAQQVREIHGEPVSGWEQRWEYGPSWIAFHCGVVIDWYSSPLRPLKVANERPAATTDWSPPKNCKD